MGSIERIHILLNRGQLCLVPQGEGQLHRLAGGAVCAVAVPVRGFLSAAGKGCRRKYRNRRQEQCHHLLFHNRSPYDIIYSEAWFPGRNNFFMPSLGCISIETPAALPFHNGVWQQDLCMNSLRRLAEQLQRFANNRVDGLVYRRQCRTYPCGAGKIVIPQHRHIFRYPYSLIVQCRHGTQRQLVTECKNCCKALSL